MLAMARWFFAVVGGVVLGTGLTLHGQVAFARFVKQEVDNTFFLWRAIGDATFAFQGGETQMALMMGSVPDAALRESDRAAWVLVIIGGLVALTAPLLRRGPAGSAARAGKPPARPPR
jgi:hypothetical protein